MRKIISFAIILLSVVLSSCGNRGNETTTKTDDTNLKKIVREMSKACPVDMGDFLSMKEITYTDGEATLSYTVKDASLLDIEAIRSNEQAFHNNMLATYANNDEKGFRKLIEAIVEAGATMNVVFNLPDNDSYKLTFTTEELKENMPGSQSNPEMMLQKIIENTQMQLPLHVDEGMACTAAELDNGYCIYTYECDEDLFDINLMAESFATSRADVVESILANDDPMFKRILRLLRQTNRGLKYRYVGATSGKEATLTVEHSDL